MATLKLSQVAFLHAFAATVNPSTTTTGIDGRTGTLIYQSNARRLIDRDSGAVMLAAVAPGLIAIDGLPVLIRRNDVSDPFGDAVRQAFNIGRGSGIQPTAHVLIATSRHGETALGDDPAATLCALVESAGWMLAYAVRGVGFDPESNNTTRVENAIADVLRFERIAYTPTTPRGKVATKDEREAARMLVRNVQRIAREALRKHAPA